MEALEHHKAAGYQQVIDIPYEFDANSRDTLIVLRQGYGLEPPNWNSRLESFFTYKGTLPVKIANSFGNETLKTAALQQLITDALDEFLPAEPTKPGKTKGEGKGKPTTTTTAPAPPHAHQEDDGVFRGVLAGRF
jgi:hypothetical protein